MAHRRSPQADSDLTDIWYFVATRSGEEAIADRVVAVITRQFLRLARNPGLGRSRAGDLRPGLRSFPVGEYVIFYRIQDEDVIILRVLHGSRDLTALLD